MTVTRAAATAKAMVMTWAMATATRLVGKKEGKGNPGKGKCNDKEGGRR
jgi:hypothetical protein